MFRWKNPRVPVFNTPLAPDVPFWAIGDIHGCYPALSDIINQIIDFGHSDAILVCVGDYVDRGEHSSDVLTFLYTLQQHAQDTVICLKGNHEQMLLRFLRDPEINGPSWLRHGGLQTLASYHLALPVRTDPDWQDLRDKLRAAMGPDIENWLQTLPSSWETGNVLVTHAGADPALPLEDQDPATYLWGHPDFETHMRQDGVWVLHGHTIVDTARAEGGRIAVDTGAYATGRLSAALVEQDSVRFIST